MLIKVYRNNEEAHNERRKIVERNFKIQKEIGSRSGAIIDTWRKVTNYYEIINKNSKNFEYKLSEKSKKSYRSDGIDPGIIEEMLNSDLPGITKAPGPPIDIKRTLASYSGYGLEYKCMVSLDALSDCYGASADIFSNFPILYEFGETLEETVSLLKGTLKFHEDNSQGAKVTPYFYTVKENSIPRHLNEKEREDLLKLFNE